ncbi:hypothetical protein BJX66DRAFT_292579 [Aspergillus keveii]|uniref:Uncharacterized protein n=1 Tax=Aspergillus keveii TaxID=714993 RepID=A0ABR4GL79_9EURO
MCEPSRAAPCRRPANSECVLNPFMRQERVASPPRFKTLWLPTPHTISVGVSLRTRSNHSLKMSPLSLKS